MSLLKDDLVKSEVSLTDLTNLLSKMTACALPEGKDKDLFMIEVSNLKIEAKKLLDEVNLHTESAGDEDEIPNGLADLKDSSFKERLVVLKQKIRAFSSQKNW